MLIETEDYCSLLEAQRLFNWQPSKIRNYAQRGIIKSVCFGPSCVVYCKHDIENAKPLIRGGNNNPLGKQGDRRKISQKELRNRQRNYKVRALKHSKQMVNNYDEGLSAGT